MSEVRIAVRGTGTMAIASLHNLQGDLKSISAENKAKLRKEILETGFAFSPHVWQDPATQEVYLLDGHQRVQVLKDLESDGFTVPPVPVTYVEAASLREAKRRILQASSQYGHMNAQGLYDFMLLSDIAVDDVKVSFDLPQIDVKKLDNLFQPQVSEASQPPPPALAEQGKAVTDGSAESHSRLVHTCPSCGHQFSKGE